MQNNKMRYCMHKDEMVVGLGRPQFGSSLHQTSKRAYPAVITCLGRMQGVARRFLAFMNALADAQEQRAYKKVLVAALKGEVGWQYCPARARRSFLLIRLFYSKF